MNMIERGVHFGDIHSFHDLNLILAPFVPTPAKPKTSYIDIPYGDGSLDLTEALGKVTYQDRDFTFTFTVNPLEDMSFDEKVAQVSNALNGLKCKITLDRDSDYYWDGRLSVDSYKQDGNLKQIVVKATVRPYKFKQKETVVEVQATPALQTITLTNGRKSVVPVITVTGMSARITFGNSSQHLSVGTHKILDLCLEEGNTDIQVIGDATITFTYQEGEL